MTKPEAAVLIHHLAHVIEDLRDLRWNDTTPQHVAAASDVHIKYLTEAASELGRLHGINIKEPIA